MEEALKDERFSHIVTDPRFRKMPRNVRKIKVDKRFKNMFKDKTFNEKCKLDPRGRALNLTSSENLKKLYNITSESSSEDEEEVLKVSKQKKKSQNKKPKTNKSTKDNPVTSKVENYKDERFNMSSLQNIEENVTSIQKENKLNSHLGKLNQPLVNLNKDRNLTFDASDDTENLKAGETDSDSSDESDSEAGSEKSISTSESSEDSDESESEDGSEKSDEFDHRWEEFQNDAPDTDQITRRLAVCNMDWDRIRAVDILIACNSFKPADGTIYSVKVYPSEFGLKRMEEEKLHGPAELIEKVLEPDEEENEDIKSSKYNREKLRQYQINRLKYYYAVVETDSPETANAVYENLNGQEYESCSVRFDVRFIPDDVTFDHEPTSTADKVPDPSEYKPRLFITSALQQVKVNLTWDETDPKRREVLQKAFTEPDTIEKDIKDYLASTSGESEDEKEDFELEDKLTTNDRIAKYKALLQSLEEKEKNEEEKYEMEITWDPSLKAKTEEIVKEKLQNESLTPFDEMLKKQKQKVKLKRQEKKMNAEASEGSSNEDLDEFSSSRNELDDGVQNNKALAELALMSDSRKALLQDKQTKGKKNKAKTENVDNFKCDVLDPRFSAIYSSHLYNLDPSDPHFKKTPGNLAILEEKQKKLKHAESDFDKKKAKRAKY